MADPIEALEERIEQLRAAVRQALMAGNRERASELRRGLREAEHAWHEALAALEQAPAEQPPPGQFPAVPPVLQLPLREQVHQALTMLTVPAAPRLISAVHEALFSRPIASARLTSLRRDEERSFRTAPFARPFYLCAALTADLLAPARGLLAVSTWPMERRVIGPLSPRVDYLTAAVQISESVERIPDPSPAAMRLVWRFAANIPGGSATPGRAEPATVARAARAELEVHVGADASTRRSAASRARSQLDDAQQLFGTRLRATPYSGIA
jgi:hypothetical protein